MKRLAILGLAISILGGMAYTQQPAQLEYKESELLLKMFQRVEEGIVLCYSLNSKTTGFFVSKHDGEGAWILTAGHKVDADFPQAYDIYIKASRMIGSPALKVIKIAQLSRTWDLLLIKVDYKPKFYFKRFNKPYPFEENWIMGFRQVSGKVPSPAGHIAISTSRGHYYTTAQSDYGNSGSPAINRYGEVLGVAVQMVRGIQDTLLVPGKEAEKYIKSIMEEEKKEK